MKYTFTVLRSNESTYIVSRRAAHSQLSRSQKSCPRCDNCAHMHQQNVSRRRKASPLPKIWNSDLLLLSWKFIDAYRVYWHFNHTLGQAKMLKFTEICGEHFLCANRWHTAAGAPEMLLDVTERLHMCKCELVLYQHKAVESHHSISSFAAAGKTLDTSIKNLL